LELSYLPAELFCEAVFVIC